MNQKRKRTAKKCTEFCDKHCEGDHHAVLFSLIKVRNKETLSQFRQLLRAYLIHGFQLDAAVPDARPSFRYPLLHWAAVLGKVEVIRMLLKPPFKVNPTLQAKTGETALHRLLNVMDKSICSSKILEIVELLHGCMTSVDRDKNTPFHVCADALTTCHKRDLELWKQVFYKMIDSVDEKQVCVDLLDQKNAECEAVLHLLSKRDDLVDVVEHLLCYGVNLHVQNLNGETPVEISWRFSVKIYNFYHMIKSTVNGRDKLKYGRILSDVKTRSSIGLSETKDYTEFFNEELHSDRDGDSGDEDSDCSFKRKVTRMNKSLIDRLTEISEEAGSSSSPPRRPMRPRKRRIILSDSDSDEEIDGYNFNARSTPRIVTSSESSDSSSSDDEEMTGHSSIQKSKRRKFNIGAEKSDERKHERKMTQSQICDEIRRTVQNIKELYAGEGRNSDEEHKQEDSSSSEDDDDDADDEEVTDENISDNIKDLDGRDKMLDNKINLLRNAIRKLTSSA